MKKIVYIATVPLIPFVQRYLRIQEVMSAGLEVEYWDLSPIYVKGRCFPGEIARQYVSRIDSVAALKERLGRELLKDTVFVLQVTYEWSVLPLYRLMSRLGCKTAFFAWVTHGAGTSLRLKVQDKLRPTKILRSGLNAIARVVRKMGLIKKYDLVFAAGRLTRSAYEGQCRVVDINYVDYDYYVSCSEKGDRVVEGEYCVFIDEGCVDNPTIKFRKMEEMDPEKFYGALRRLFDYVEQRFNLRVVVAGHPGIKYDQSVFGDRAVHEGKTCELVRDAKLVVSQSSTATSFAVFYEKPVVFVYTNEYELVRRENFRIMKFLSHELGAPSYNIDLSNELEPIQVPVADSVLYDCYKYTSFTSEQTQGKRSDDIIAKSLAAL